MTPTAEPPRLCRICDHLKILDLCPRHAEALILKALADDDMDPDGDHYGGMGR